VLGKRQQVPDEVAHHEKTIAPAKWGWTEYLGTLAPADRARAEGLLADTRRLLEEITSADRNDTLVLQQRKLNLGRQISQASAAKQVNRTYAAAAYGGNSGKRMDVQR
jgi:hypothetical protein